MQGEEKRRGEETDWECYICVCLYLINSAVRKFIMLQGWFSGGVRVGPSRGASRDGLKWTVHATRYYLRDEITLSPDCNYDTHEQ